MVFISRKLLVRILLGIKQIVSCQKLKNHACQRPNINRRVVITANNDLRWAILPGCNLVSEVLEGPACISEICNLGNNISGQLLWDIFSRLVLGWLPNVKRIKILS